MGDLNEFSLPVKLFLKTYRWRKIDPVPWAPLKKPLDQCRLALVSTAGFVLPGQTPFDKSIRGGDYSFREIPNDADVSELVFGKVLRVADLPHGGKLHFITDENQAVAHITIVKEEVVATPAEAAAAPATPAEPEVIKKGKQETEEGAAAEKPEKPEKGEKK